MSKIAYLIISMIALYVSLSIFSCSNWDVSTGQCVGTESIGTNSSNVSSIFSFVENPTEVDDSSFWKKLMNADYMGLIAAIGATVLIAGLYLTKDSQVIYYAISVALITVIYPSIKLWQLITGFSGFGDAFSKKILAMAVISSMIVVSLVIVLDWARGKE